MDHGPGVYAAYFTFGLSVDRIAPGSLYVWSARAAIETPGTHADDASALPGLASQPQPGAATTAGRRRPPDHRNPAQARQPPAHPSRPAHGRTAHKSAGQDHRAINVQLAGAPDGQ